MEEILVVYLVIFIMGLAAVASNPSPYFAALGLVVVAGGGCGVLIAHGASFLSVVLFLIYLGGMLVVFAYSVALAAEDYPEGLGSWPVKGLMIFYGVLVLLMGVIFSGGWYVSSSAMVDEFLEFSLFRGDIGGVALVYSVGGGMLVIAAWVLLLTLFVVLELVRGLGRGALRAV